MMDWNLGTAARTLWQEARGEPIEGQRAVAHVLVNRRISGRWGNTFGEVCFSEFHGIFQFSGWDRNDPNRVAAFRLSDDDPALTSLANLIAAADGGEPDSTNGATHYFASSIAPPDWVKGAVFCGKFGNQLFYKGVA